MDALLAKLSEQQANLAKQRSALSPEAESTEKAEDLKPIKNEKQAKDDSSASSTLLTPASGSFGRSSPANDGEDTIKLEAAEVARLKKELDAAKDQIALQKHELDQTRVIQHTFDQAIGPPNDTALGPRGNTIEPAATTVNSSRPFAQVQTKYEDSRFSSTDPVGSLNPFPSVWSGASRSGLNVDSQHDQGWSHSGARSWAQRGAGNAPPPVVMPPQPSIQSRNYSMPVSPVRGNGRGTNDFGQLNQIRGFGQGNLNRNPSLFQRGNGWEVYAGGLGPMDDMSLSGMTTSSPYQTLGMYPPPYQPQPIGTPLSPTAPEFRGGSQASANPWNNAVSHASTEPLVFDSEVLTFW